MTRKQSCLSGLTCQSGQTYRRRLTYLVRGGGGFGDGFLTILAVDSTSELASVAIRRDGRTVAEEAISASDGHSHLIFQMIESALQTTGLRLEDIDCFATASGPGSFTGVRICMTAAKGLADAMGKPAVGISNLRALSTLGGGELRNPILDARRGQIYTALYNRNTELVQPETLTTVDEWRAPGGAEAVQMSGPLAGAIAHCADLDGPSKWQDPAALDANYVRRSDAEMFWMDRSKKST